VSAASKTEEKPNPRWESLVPVTRSSVAWAIAQLSSLPLRIALADVLRDAEPEIGYRDRDHSARLGETHHRGVGAQVISPVVDRVAAQSS